VSALLLASLFFKLGIEQRGREVGLLRAVGYGAGSVRRLFMGEGLVLAFAGSVLGIAGGIGYAWLIMTALRTWWVGAVGTTALTLHVTPVSLAAGAIGGVGAAAICIWWTLRSLRRISERSLLSGQLSFEPGGDSGRRARRLQLAAAVLALGGLALVGAGVSGWLAANGAFFGAGALLLAGSLCLFAGRLRAPVRGHVVGTGWRPVTRLGLRAATHRPGRSVLSAAVIASATFMLISVDAFRRGSVDATSERSSGVGGYQVLVETLLPIVHDPNSDEGRQALGLTGLGDATRLEPFRLLPGDDASCLNLYAPKNPRILGAADAFLNERRFSFASSLAVTDDERDNPWQLLKRAEPDGAIPVIGDANSMTYVLHRAVGEEFLLDRGGEPIRLRFVAALRDSVFQGELIMAESNFVRLFPDQQGSNVLLVESPTEDVAALTTTIEESLADLGADATGTVERLAAFHQVENTYLSTFQTLGGLGLLLGTVGLATVLLRNALERRKEMALLSAVGYRRGHFGLMALAENSLLLGVGLAAGAASASLAIAPAVAERGGRLPLSAGGVLLLLAVFVIGLLSSALATRAALRAPLLASLRSE
jgi:ABC-type lipoprotein release transport system permease subunit